MVYTNINDPYSPTNSLSFNNINVGVYDTLKPFDVCINFPVIEITYRADLLESFKSFTGKEKELHDLYGHVFANKVLAGGQLLIKNFNSASLKQGDILKFFLILAYNSARNNNEIPFNNISFDSDILPKLETSNGILLNTLKKLSNWLKKLYQDNIIDIISYNNLISISQLKSGILADNLENEKNSGIANFKEKLSLEKWAGDTVYLVKWIKDFRLFQGLIINKSYKIESSKKFSINFLKVPEINLNNKSYFKTMNPTTKLEEILISNNIFSIKNIALPFIKIDGFSDKDCIHLIVECQRYEIIMDRDHIKPSKEFNNAVEKALDDMKPFNALQDLFNEYGHVLPLNIILGKSLKNISTTSFDKNNSNLPMEFLKSYKLNISYLITQKGDVIEENDLPNWIENISNDDLEIIEYDKIISLYDILGLEQKRKVDIVLNNNNQDNLKIIMTGINDLKDLDNKNVEHYKRINIESSLEDENYKVFGSIITKNNLKTEDFFVRFSLYDVNGFSAMITTLKNTTNIDITECYILWMIIGNPLKLSVFSPKNREIQVDYINKSIIQTG